MGHHSTIAEEVCEYLLTPHIPTIEKTLQWWAHDQDRFPSLAKLCKIYLAVPATIFSLAWNTITRQWESLHPAHVHANQDRKAKTE